METTHPPGLAIASTGLTKQYGGRTVVDRLDLAVPEGVVCGFVGPNGAGKTTTIRMLLGLVRPSAGAGTVLGESLDAPARYLGRVGAMIEGPAFHPSLSGRVNLLLLARTGGLPGQSVPDVLARVGLAARADDPFRSYSLGMKQRLGIAAALLPRPRLLVLDEPTNGLDPAGIVDMRDLLRSLQRDGMTVLVSSHLLAEIEQVCDHLVLLRHGRLVFAGELGELVAAQAPVIVADTVDGSGYDAVVSAAAALGFAASVVPSLTQPVSGAPTTGVRIDVGTPEGGSDHAIRAVAAALNAKTAAAGVVLARLEIHRPTLEQTFLDLTGEAAPPVNGYPR